MPERLESDIEAKVVAHAKSRGCLERKMNGPGYRGWPDRLFGYNGKVMWVEFKQKGEKPFSLQRYIHGRLQQHGFTVEVVDNVQSGKDLIDRFVASSSDF